MTVFKFKSSHSAFGSHHPSRDASFSISEDVARNDIENAEDENQYASANDHPPECETQLFRTHVWLVEVCQYVDPKCCHAKTERDEAVLWAE